MVVLHWCIDPLVSGVSVIPLYSERKMIDASDVGDGFAYGGVIFGIILLVWYLAFSKPEIEKCHEKGGQIVRIEGTDKCMDTSSLKVVK